MRLIHPHLLLASALVACGQGTGHAGTNASMDDTAAADGTRKYEEGRDYLVLQRVRVIDPSGFGQPVEAFSFLLPRGWKLEGGVTWRVGHPCMNEAVAVRYTATSPDGTMRIDGYPVRSWQWNDDPMTLQSMQANAQGYGRTCDILPPYDATQFVQQLFLPELEGAQMADIARAEELSRAMEEQARRNGAAMQANGVGSVEFRPSAVKAHLRFPDGSAGTLLCSVDQTVFFMQNFMTGGMSGSYQCQSNFRLVMRYPPGRTEEAERILGTAISSARVNPAWQQAVQQVFANVGRVQQQEEAKRAAIWRQTNAEISASQQRSWEARQESQDRISTAWGQAIRGVDEWKDAGGNNIELSAGYNEAWSRPDGSYILSNDPLFDPSVVFQEDWKRMEKAR